MLLDYLFYMMGFQHHRRKNYFSNALITNDFIAKDTKYFIKTGDLIIVDNRILIAFFDFTSQSMYVIDFNFPTCSMKSLTEYIGQITDVYSICIPTVNNEEISQEIRQYSHDYYSIYPDIISAYENYKTPDKQLFFNMIMVICMLKILNAPIKDLDDMPYFNYLTIQEMINDLNFWKPCNC